MWVRLTLNSWCFSLPDPMREGITVMDKKQMFIGFITQPLKPPSGMTGLRKAVTSAAGFHAFFSPYLPKVV